MSAASGLKYPSYEEFLASFRLEVPANYNFALDFFDKTARERPDELALVHVDDAGVRRDYTYADLSRASSKLASALRGQGFGKGDRVMIILYRRVEFWISMLALHKLGVLAVPRPRS